MKFVGFIGPSYTLQSVNADCQRCVNLYPEIDELGSAKEQSVASLVGTPGLQLIATLPLSPFRGCFTSSKGQLYAVGGNGFYKISNTWNVTFVGYLLSTTGQVSFADNGTSVVVVDGSNGYVLTIASDDFTQISDPDFLGADMVTFQDGYFIFNKPNSGQFYISGINSTDLDALDIATSEGNPDNIVGLISDHRDLWIFNKSSIEVFFNSGNADFPFERVQGAFIEHGCAAKFSIAKMNNTVYWVGQDDKGNGMVFQASGYQPTRISTHALELAIRSYGDVSGAVAWTYQENGHHFYVLNFTNAKTTWVFDTTTNLWHERTYNNAGIQERHRANGHSFAYNSHVVGDYANGKIYKLNSAYYKDDTAEIIRIRAAPHVSSDLVRMFHNSLQVDLEGGVGLDGSSQGIDPKIMMQFSDDGGHSWSNEKWSDIGQIGAFKARAIWRRLGQSRDRVYRLTISDPIKVTLLNAQIDVMSGAS